MFLQNILDFKSCWVFGYNNLVVSKTMVLSKPWSFWSFRKSTHDLFFLNHGFVCLWLIKPQCLSKQALKVSEDFRKMDIPCALQIKYNFVHNLPSHVVIFEVLVSLDIH